MMSNSSSQFGAGHQRLAAISSAVDADVHETRQSVVVEPTADGSASASGPVEEETSEQAKLLGAAGWQSFVIVYSCWG